MRTRITHNTNKVELNAPKISQPENDFRVMVWNKGTPKFVHYDSESAMIEGIRLSKSENKRVMVVQVLALINPIKVK